MYNKNAEREFEALVRENEALIYKICRIYTLKGGDLQDLFQEIIIQLWKAFPRFRGDSKLSTWIYRVGINTAISAFRKQKKTIVGYELRAISEEVRDIQYGPEEERLQDLYRAIAQLNSIEKAIVMLYLEDNNYEEMEEVLGISQGNLRVKMNRIKEKLRQLTKNN